MTDFPPASVIRGLPGVKRVLPTGHHVYGLFRDDVILYVGATKNIRRRLNGHTLKPWNNIRLIPVSPNEMLGLERNLIRQWKPPLNSFREMGAPRIPRGPSPICIQFGVTLRALRLERGHSLRSLQKESKVPIGLLFKLEGGNGNPCLFTLHRLARALRVGVAELV